jgi:hypothetical protein
MSRKNLLFIALLCIVIIAGIAASPARSQPIPKANLTPSSGGSPIASPFVIADQDVDTVNPAVAHNSIFDQYLVVWYNDRPGYDDIYAHLLDGNGKPSGSWHPIAYGAGAERRSPDVAFNPNFNEYLVVWEQIDESTGGYSIRGQRVDMTGLPTGNEITIATPTTIGGTAMTPKVEHAFTAGKYLVVWNNHTQGNLSSDIFGQLVINDGTLDGGKLVISQGTTGFSMGKADLAYNRRMNEFLVAWDQIDKGANLYDIYARIVRPDHSMPPTKIEISRVTASSTNPTVAALPIADNDGQYLVAYELQYKANDKDILGLMINGDGNPEPSVLNIARSAEDESNPAAVGHDGLNHYLITWQKPSPPPLAFNSVWGRVFTTDGIPAAAEKWTGGVFADHPAVAAGDQGEYLVVYDDLTLTANQDIYGRLWGNRVYIPFVRR